MSRRSPSGGRAGRTSLARRLALVVALAASAGPARATVREQAFELTLAAPPKRSGGVIRGQVMVRATRADVTVAVLRVAEGAVAVPVKPGRPAALAEGVLVPFEVPESAAAAPLRLQVEGAGARVERWVDLSRFDDDGRVVPGTLVAAGEVAVPVGDGEHSVAAPLPTDAPLSPSLAKGSGDAVQSTLRVRGRLVYLREDGVAAGADGATVRIYDDDGLFDGLLASGTTNWKGEFDLSFDWAPCLLCDQKPDLYAEFESGNSRVSVEIAGALTRYSWRTGVVQNFGGTLLDFGTLLPGVERDAPALHVLTVAQRAWRWYRDNSGFDLPPVAYTWPWYGPGTFYTRTPFGGRMFVQPANQWREDTICHEYGHHFVYSEGYSQPPAYCNGLCDDEGDFPIEVDQICGHCLWCPEDGAIAWSEGFPNFMAHVQTTSFAQAYGLASRYTRDQEGIGICGDGGAVSPATTEGFLGALLQDIWDAERDTVVQQPARGQWWDRLALGHDEILTVAAQDEPRSALDFIAKFAARYPQFRDSLWETAEHNGFVQDVVPPPAPTGLTCLSHPTNEIVDDPTVRLRWDPVTDDFSGIDHYRVVIENLGPLYPIRREMDVRGTEAAVPYVSGGTRVARVSAVDRAGNEGPAVEYAPILVGLGAICDLEPYALPGWAYPIMPSKVCAGTQPVLPDTLQGGTPTTCLWYGSINTGATSCDARAAAFVDDRLLTAEPSLPYSPGGVRFHYPPLLPVPGGRHTLTMKVDDLEAAVEADELDNAWGRQWVWTPARLRQGVPVVREVPGPRTGGWEDAPFVPLYFNSDGLRFEATGAWNAVHVRPVGGTAEVDCRLHFATHSADSGFATARGVSQRPGTMLDAVLVNARVAAPGWYDVGVLNANDSTGVYEAKHVVSVTQPADQDFFLYFSRDDRMLLAEVDVPPALVGQVSIDVEVEENFPGVYAAWFDRGFARGGLLDATAMALTPTGPVPARLDVMVSGPGRHLVALWRDEFDLEYGVRVKVRRSIPDLVVHQPAGWHAPFVPSAVARTAASVPAPDTLRGGAPETFWNVALRNDSGIAAPVTSGGILVDGFERYVLGYPAVPANGVMLTNYDFGQTVTGGRHTVGYVADSPALIEELLEDNNRYGEQYVWSPQELALVTLAYRALPPPDPLGGFDDVTTGEPFHYNSDGWRTPPFAARFGYWGAVVVTPEDEGDVDLRLHEAMPGAKDGFREALAVSAWGPGQTDYVIVDFNRTAFRRFDVGVLRGPASSPGYWMLSMQSSRHTLGGGWLGPYALGADRMLRLHEFQLPGPGVYPLRLENQSATVDLGVTVHGGRAFASKSDGIGGSPWIAGAARTSTFLVQVDSAGWYCVAVWRTGAAQRAGTAQFRIDLAAPSVDAAGPPPPAVTAFAAPRPNPARGEVRFGFDLAREAEVRLEVFDVTGARVRTLAAGRRAAGRHDVRWEARDEAGRPLPPGIYLVRFEGGGLSATRRVALVR